MGRTGLRACALATRGEDPALYFARARICHLSVLWLLPRLYMWSCACGACVRPVSAYERYSHDIVGVLRHRSSLSSGCLDCGKTSSKTKRAFVLPPQLSLIMLYKIKTREGANQSTHTSFTKEKTLIEFWARAWRARVVVVRVWFLHNEPSC